MKKICRRKLFIMTPIGLAFAASGCAALQSASTKLPQFAQDATLIASSLGAIADGASGISGVPAALLGKIKTSVATVQQLASSIAGSAASGASALSGTISGFGSTVSGLLSSLGGISLPGWVSTGLSAVSALLPTILAVAGVVLAGPSQLSSMSPPAARAYLAGLAK